MMRAQTLLAYAHIQAGRLELAKPLLERAVNTSTPLKETEWEWPQAKYLSLQLGIREAKEALETAGVQMASEAVSIFGSVELGAGED